MNTIMILGAGYMGSGIAQVCAAAGYHVLLWDMTEELVQKGIDKIASGLDARIAKGKATVAYKEELLGKMEAVTELTEAKRADLVLEVVVEKLDIKYNVLRQVEAACEKTTMIASNTSYLPITALAECLENKDRFLGLHFFGPVPAMKLVEIIKGEQTSKETVKAAQEFVCSIGKTPVVIQKDAPGFLVNRINAAIRMEAFRCYEEGIASIADIDTALKLGLNHPMGPFELNDMSGIEIGLAGLDTLYERTGEERWKAIDKARELVDAGELGRKTGKGWYDYTTGEKRPRPELNK